MATINLCFERERKDGTCSVNIAVSHKRVKLFVRTGYMVERSKASIKNGALVLPAAYPQGKAITKKVCEYVQRAQLFVVENNTKRLTCAELRDKIENFVLGKCSHSNSNTFLDIYEEFLEEKQGGTKEVYTCTYNRLKLYYEENNLYGLECEDITCKWLKDFEAWLSRTNKVNSIGIHMRNIRAAFNYALDNEYTTAYPFRKYKIKKEATKSRALSLVQLKQLLHAEREEWIDKYVDLFFIIFGLRGINMADLCEIKRIDSDGYIRYTRAKTHKHYAVKVEPEILALINKHKGDKYLLNYFDTNHSHDQVSKQLNRSLRKIMYCGTPMFPDITAYWARHTLASVAYNDANCEMDTISDILGHSSGLSVTNIYVARSQRKIDDAMRKVFDLVF